MRLFDGAGPVKGPVKCSLYSTGVSASKMDQRVGLMEGFLSAKQFDFTYKGG